MTNTTGLRTNMFQKLEALCANMHILIAGLDVCQVLAWKGNLTDSTEWNTGETGDID